MGVIAAFRLGEWRVEPAANTLMRVKEEIHLEPKVMEVLSCLAEHAGEVVSKRELIDAVWQTEFIAENTLTRAIAEIRRALGDDSRHPTYIQTIPKRGYRLLPEVVRDQVASAGFSVGEFVEPERPVFVAREAELAKLDGLLDAALDGAGTVAFVTGEAGIGKTALVEEFSLRALERHSDLVVTWGACNAATGAGDPYGPWRQVLSQLTGDVESGTTGGVLGRVQTQRLWTIAPEGGRAIADHGIDLVETMVSGQGLVERLTATATEERAWLEVLRQQAEFRMAVPAAADIRQGALFEQFARVVRQLSSGRPLLLVVEDLHWADAGSANLLFHLGRRLAGSRVMVVGTHRPSEVALGRNGGRHPVEHVLHELKREHGDTVVKLAQTGDLGFVEALVDSEPNHLGPSFREALYEQTRGHALFTVELLRAMQDRGGLVKGEDDAWVESADLDWQTLPARVEGALEERISRLPDKLRDLLTVAAIEGEEFTAEVVARVRNLPDRDVVKTLGRDLERRHRLVAGRGLRHMSGSRLSRYRFGHSLFSSYLYETLDEAERAYLHHDVGSALEELYGEDVGQIAAELARHFERAGHIEKAVSSLGLAAGRAIMVSAFSEAAALNRRALCLLRSSPESPERERASIEHLRMLVTAVGASKGWSHPEVLEIAEELRQRCTDAGDVEGRSWALFLIIYYLGNRPDFRSQVPLLTESLKLAEASGNPLLLMAAHWSHLYYIWAGEPARALEHLEQAASLLNEEIAERYLRLTGFDARAILPMWIGVALLFIGHADRAMLKLFQAVADADKLGNPFSRAFVRGLVGPILAHSGVEAGLVLSEECIAIASERGFDDVVLYGMLGRVFEAAARGDGEPNERCLAMMEASTFRQPYPWCLRIRCALLVAAGQAEEAMSEIRRTRDFMDESWVRFDESGIDRLEGDALALLDDFAGAEQAYLRAIEVARRQQMRPFELEAASALARLWQAQGKAAEAREVLQPVYDWFTEGLNSRPLVEARKLLDRLEV